MVYECAREVLKEAGADVPRAASIDKTLKEWGLLIRQQFVAANEPLKHPPGSTDLAPIKALLSEVASSAGNVASRLDVLERVPGERIVGLLESLSQRLGMIEQAVGISSRTVGGVLAYYPHKSHQPNANLHPPPHKSIDTSGLHY